MKIAEACQYVVGLLHRSGVKHCVTSPGTRNAPLLDAISSHSELVVKPVIDERTAAFYALGVATTVNRPVLLCCTSGSAPLNYAPALAEALYRKVPLIALTADRPREAVERNLQQTIHQSDALHNVVKGEYSIDCRDTADYIHDVISDAVGVATTPPCGPVHVNLAIDDPRVTNDIDYTKIISKPVIEVINPAPVPPVAIMRDIATEIGSTKKVIIVAGGYRPDAKLNRSLDRLLSFGNYAVLAEWMSNLHAAGVCTNTDLVMAMASRDTYHSLVPDVVITFGTPLLSTHAAQYIKNNNIEHWHVGMETSVADSFGTLTRHYRALPELFFPALVAATRKSNLPSLEYSERWVAMSKAVETRVNEAIGRKFNDISAIQTVLKLAPRPYNLQLSNGMTSRYVNALSMSAMKKQYVHSCSCNRGVSGIDGSTSTAIGAASCYNGMTLFITGDTSALYDIGALNISNITPDFKMVVINNGGGEIFRTIKATREFNKLEEIITLPSMLPFRGLAESLDLAYFTADDNSSLHCEVRKFYAECSRPAILEIRTTAGVTAEIYRGLFKI